MVVTEPAHWPHADIEAQTLTNTPVDRHQFARQPLRPQNREMFWQSKFLRRRDQLFTAVRAVRIEVAFHVPRWHQQSKRAERPGTESLVH